MFYFMDFHKAEALLVCLDVEGRPLDRYALANLFSTECTEEHASISARVALSSMVASYPQRFPL